MVAQSDVLKAFIGHSTDTPRFLELLCSGRGYFVFFVVLIFEVPIVRRLVLLLHCEVFFQDGRYVFVSVRFALALSIFCDLGKNGDFRL